MKATLGTKYEVSGDDCIEVRYKKPKHTYNTVKTVYNQSEFSGLSKNACSIYASMTAISNNHDIFFTKEERQQILEEAQKAGFDPTWGWYMSTACNFTAEWTRKNKGLNIRAVRIGWTKIRKMCALGWGVVTGYKGRKGFWDDRLDGTIGDDDIKYGESKFGHLVSTWNMPHLFLLSRFMYLDNYGENYKFKETYIKKFRDLRKADVMFSAGYYFESY